MSTDVRTPSQLRAAAAVVALEAVGLLVAAGVLLTKVVLGDPDSLTSALLEAALALMGATMLGFGARGLLQVRHSSRTPVIVLQLLSLPVAYSLAFQAGLVVYGGPILLAALSVLYLLFTPPVRAAFDREPVE